MPLQITHKPLQKIVLSRPSGVYTMEDGLSAWQRFCDTHDLSAGCDVIVDHSNADDYDITYSDMRTLAAHIRRLLTQAGPTTRIAHYCPKDHGFGMARMFEQIATTDPDYLVGVFNEPGELADWLGLSHQTILDLTEEIDFLKWAS